MGERWLALIKNGMDVCDMTGEKIGTVREVYARVGAAARPEVDQSRRAEPAAGAGPYVEVATGFLGLGRSFYVPARAIRDVTDFVLLDLLPRQLDRMGWDDRPNPLGDPPSRLGVGRKDGR